jgi:hypothetical protein
VAVDFSLAKGFASCGACLLVKRTALFEDCREIFPYFFRHFLAEMLIERALVQMHEYRALFG